MAYYIISILLAAGLYFFDYKSTGRLKSNTYLVLLAIFLTGGYMTGTDWRSYERLYYLADFSVLGIYSKELGFYYLISFFNSIGVGFWPFLISIKILFFLIITRFLRRNNINYSLFFIIFLPEIGFYLFIDNPLRNFIALIFWFISIRYIYERKLFIFIFLMTIAIFFHISALVMIPLYFLRKINLPNYIIIILYIVASIIATQHTYTYEIINYIIGRYDILFERFHGYVGDEDFRLATYSIIHKGILLLIVLYLKPYIFQHNYGKLFFSFSILFFIAFPFAITAAFFQRFIIYTNIFAIISIVIGIENYKDRLIKSMLIWILILLSLLKTYSVITFDHRYIPYTNYYEHALRGDFPTYYERSNHNYQKSQ